MATAPLVMEAMTGELIQGALGRSLAASVRGFLPPLGLAFRRDLFSFKRIFRFLERIFFDHLPSSSPSASSSSSTHAALSSSAAS